MGFLHSKRIDNLTELLHCWFQQKACLLSQAATVFETKTQGIWYQNDSNFIMVSCPIRKLACYNTRKVFVENKRTTCNVTTISKKACPWRDDNFQWSTSKLEKATAKFKACDLTCFPPKGVILRSNFNDSNVTCQASRPLASLQYSTVFAAFLPWSWDTCTKHTEIWLWD